MLLHEIPRPPSSRGPLTPDDTASHGQRPSQPVSNPLLKDAAAQGGMVLLIWSLRPYLQPAFWYIILQLSARGFSAPRYGSSLLLQPRTHRTWGQCSDEECYRGEAKCCVVLDQKFQIPAVLQKPPAPRSHSSRHTCFPCSLFPQEEDEGHGAHAGGLQLTSQHDGVGGRHCQPNRSWEARARRSRGQSGLGESVHTLDFLSGPSIFCHHVF